MHTSDSRSCEPRISINDGKAVGGKVENNVEIKLFAVFDIWNESTVIQFIISNRDRGEKKPNTNYL